uniref:choline ABC transporter substrate-binding protein n=1 Tax=Marinobacterium profundum TaxID=1714300 RepID=UPI0008373FB2|nr:choline ABC transporter substrate-binding protein [Marinobacterium profundum]
MQSTFQYAITGVALALGMAVTSQVLAADIEACQLVRFTDPGWTDVSAANAVAANLLQGLGYETSVSLLGAPIGFESLKSGSIDVFLGNWLPAQQRFIDKYGEDVDSVGANLAGAKFTLAVPQYVYDSGVKSFSDLARYADKFDKRIYGVDPGAAANGSIQKMIDKGDFGLAGWRLVESGEQAMLSQVQRALRKQDFIVFLGWEPHPMNLRFDMAYLSGGDDYFGPDYGGATINTVTRKDYAVQCPNVGTLLSNLEFSLDMQSEIMGGIIDDNKTPEAAAREWIKAHPEALAPWLDNVTARDGQPGLSAVQAHLGISAS